MFGTSDCHTEFLFTVMQLIPTRTEQKYDLEDLNMNKQELPLSLKLVAAGSSACFADFVTFPLDTAKVRLQVQGETKTLKAMGSEASAVGVSAHRYRGVFGTIMTICKTEGPRCLYNGLSAGLQRQMCFASVRLGMYDSVKSMYNQILYGSSTATGMNVGVRIAAGLTTGCLAVLLAQPTDVVKVRFQAQLRGDNRNRYSSTMKAYQMIGKQEGVRGLWKGTLANCSRNAIVNVAEIVCYDMIKETILYYDLMKDAIPCHFTSAVVAGFCTTVVASPVDVVKTRFMNSTPGTYRGAGHCALNMFGQEGFFAFYKGFTPSFCRLVSWNIVLWITYEQVKLFLHNRREDHSIPF